VRNNPVRLAYEEESRIWPNSKAPDIILSLGTSILVDKDGNIKSKKNEHLEKVKSLLPSGVRKKVETGLDMVEATLDCHREWVDFVGGLQTRPGLHRRNCHRLDIGLTSKPPALDATDEMWSLSFKTSAYLSRNPDALEVPYVERGYKCGRDHIKVVARRLLASIFFLGRDLPLNLATGVYETAIHCRLTPKSQGALMVVANEPQFRVREVASNGDQTVRTIQFVSGGGLDPNTLSGRVKVKVLEGQSARYVEVLFPLKGREWEPIGGF